MSAQAILAAKSTTKTGMKAADATEQLQNLAAADALPLLSFKTVFPFDLFPDEITIDRNKITVNRHYFFFDSMIQSVLIKDVMTVVVEQSLFFASMQIVDRMPVRRTISLAKLPKDQAKMARWIIEGLIVSSQQKGLDLTNIPNDVLLPKLIELGKAKNP